MSHGKNGTYAAFLERVREIHIFRSVEALLEWDQETCMPRRGAAHRAEQIAAIAGEAHRRLVADELRGLLEAVEREGTGDDPMAATNVREMRRLHDRAARVPAALVQEIARTATLSRETWAAARRSSRFEVFAPQLQRLLDLKRQWADCVGWRTERYDALLDEYEPGARAADIEPLFESLKAELIPLVAQVARSSRRPPANLLHRPAPQAQQAEFNRQLAGAIGYDFEAGRMDVSNHPFCSGTCPQDVRITTRYDENHLAGSLFAALHETGHALYEQGLDARYTATPAGQAVSLGIHESQSRLWENLVGRSRPFWEHFLPALRKQFDSLADVTLDDWYFAINHVQPSLIRVHADEVTYGLHVILRFGLERKLIDGRLSVADVPQAWNDGMRELLGVTPPRDAEGCLQDIHWSAGIFGYFPTYVLGNLYAAQFFEKVRADLPDLDAQHRRGDFRPLLEWLRAHVHRHGMRYSAPELIEVVSGAPLSPQPFVRYLRGKFNALYGAVA